MERRSSMPASAFVSIAWELVEDPPDASATAFAIRFALPDGARLARVDARETGSQVFVTVLAQRAAAPGSRGDDAAAPAAPAEAGAAAAAAAAPAEADPAAAAADAPADTDTAPDAEPAGGTATVTLAAPLGDRALVHAPHDDPPR